MTRFTSHMALALDQARAAALRDEVPVGAVVVAPDAAPYVVVVGGANVDIKARTLAPAGP